MRTFDGMSFKRTVEVHLAELPHPRPVEVQILVGLNAFTVLPLIFGALMFVLADGFGATKGMLVGVGVAFGIVALAFLVAYASMWLWQGHRRGWWTLLVTQTAVFCSGAVFGSSTLASVAFVVLYAALMLSRATRTWAHLHP